MALMSRSILLFTCLTGILAQDRQLQVASEGDCYLKCWRESGFCQACGGGDMACCPIDGSSSNAQECKGVFQGKDVTSYREYSNAHICVKGAFQPGEASPNYNWDNDISDHAKAQCTGYMASRGCGWTKQYSCPGQPQGYDGLVTDKTTVGYKCCCINSLWKESVDISDRPINPVSTQVQCATYMSGTGCGWTAKYNCPGQTAGSEGQAGDDGTTGYDCCCRQGMYKQGQTTLNGNLPDPNAFNIDHDMDGNVADAGVNQVGGANGLSVSVSGGQQVGTNVAGNRNGNLQFEHEGPNVHTHTVAMTNPEFESKLHMGPIHNRLSQNTPKSKKERCVNGICAPTFSASDPGNHNSLPETQHGLPVLQGTENKPKELPSIVAEMDDGDKQPKLLTVQGGVVTASAPAGGGVISAPPAAAPTPAPIEGTPMAARVDAPVAPTPAPVAAPAPAAAQTTLSSAAAVGATVVTVSSSAGFLIGDQILVGNTDRVTIVDVGTATTGNATRLSVSPAVGTALPAGTPVQKVPAENTQASSSTGSGTSGSDSSLFTSSAGYGWVVCLVLVCCLCIAAAGGGAFVMMRGQNKKKRNTTDREAYLKNDFIERQPMYQDVPPQQALDEVEPMMAQKDQGVPMAAVGIDYNNDGRVDAVYTGADLNRDGIPDALQAPQTLEPTQSFPVQVELAQTAPVTTAMAPVTQFSGVSFPGLPTIGGANGGMLQQTMAAPSTAQYIMQPQAASMTATMPYGNYTTGSTYIAAPSAMSYSQLGVTSAVQQYPGGGVV